MILLFLLLFFIFFLLLLLVHLRTNHIFKRISNFLVLIEKFWLWGFAGSLPQRHLPIMSPLALYLLHLTNLHAIFFNNFFLFEVVEFYVVFSTSILRRSTSPMLILWIVIFFAIIELFVILFNIFIFLLLLLWIWILHGFAIHSEMKDKAPETKACEDV